MKIYFREIWIYQATDEYRTDSTLAHRSSTGRGSRIMVVIIFPLQPLLLHQTHDSARRGSSQKALKNCLTQSTCRSLTYYQSPPPPHSPSCYQWDVKSINLCGVPEYKTYSNLVCTGMSCRLIRFHSFSSFFSKTTEQNMNYKYNALCWLVQRW